MDLSIITVSWNVWERLRSSIRSIIDNAGGLDFEIIVVDNASHDSTPEKLAKEFPQVKLIANKENKGFASANNQGLAIASGEFILFLNPDMRVLPPGPGDAHGTLKTMVDFMRANPSIGIASCKLITEDGNVLREVRRFPNIWSQLAVVFKLGHLFPSLMKRVLAQDIDLEKEQDVEQVRGSFFMVNRKMIEQIGAWDERFFIWFEDVDWCKRACDSGWRVVYTPHAKCIDYVGQSFKQARMYHKQKHFTASMIKYFEKHGRPWEVMLLRMARPVGLAAAWIYDNIALNKRGKSM